MGKDSFLNKNRKNILLGLSIAGILVSLYLTYAKLTATPLICLDKGCGIVQNSKYSEIFGIPVALLGVLYYFAMFIFVFKDMEKLAKLSAITGIIFSVYLTYLELFVIDAICTWCVISFFIVILITILLFLKKDEQLAQPEQI